MPSVGPRLKVDGFADYTKRMNDLIQQGKTLDSEMKRVASAWDDSTTAQEKAADKAEVLAKKIENQKQQVDALNDVLQKAKDQYGENSREAQAYQEKLNTAEAALNDMNHELGQAQSEMKETGDRTKEVGEKSETSGKKMEAFGKAAKITAAAATAAFAATITAAVKLVSAMKDMTVQGGKYADEVLSESTKTGIATDQLQKYKYAADLVDVSTETLTKSMAKNTKNMASAADGTGAAAEAYDQLGISVTDSNGHLRDSEAVFWEAVDALGNIANETERDALAMSLFGKSAQELNPLIETGSERMKELGKEAEKAGAILSEDTLDAYARLDDRLAQLEAGAEAAKRAVGTALLPVIEQLAGEGVDMLGDFSNAILDCNGDMDKMSKVAGDYLGKAVKKISEYIPEMGEMGSKLIGGLLEGIAENTPAILDATGEALDSVLEVIVENSPEIAEALLTFTANLAESLGKAVWNIGYNIGYKIGKSIREGIFGAEETGEEEADQYYTADGNRLITSETSGIHKRGEGIGNSRPVNSRDADAQANKEYREGLLEVYNQTEAIKACVEAANEAIAELEQSYYDAYDAALSSIQGQYKLWDTIDDKAEDATMTIGDLNAAMDSQIEYWTGYADNLQNLMGRNIAGLSEMVAAMDDGSAQSKAAIGALAEASDEEIMKMVTKWQELQEAQGRAAGANRDATFDMEDAVEKMAEKTEAKLDEIGQSMDISDDARSAAKRTLQAFTDGLNDGVANAVSSAKTVGDQIATGVSTGLDNAAWKITEAGKNAVTGALASMRAVAQIASPSKVTTGYGRYLVEGLVAGVEEASPKFVKSTGEMMADAIGSIEKQPGKPGTGGTDWVRTVGREIAASVGGGSLPAAGSNIATTSTTYNNTKNLGGVAIEINAAPGQDEEAIADAVMDRINDAMTSERDVWGG